jgi:tetratricopeptide (TPR) repeat protein
MRRLAWALMIALIGVVGIASAQPQVLTVASAESVARGLEAQYRAALIRERRLANDRETELIAEAETRMRAARQAYVSATGDRAQAQAALDACRLEFVRLVEEVPLHDAALRIEVEAFRAEVEGRLPEATPELVAAYREFADGDRTRAWRTLEHLLLAQANARRAAARAVAAGEVRQLAGLREVMRRNGEATVADVLALWDQAAELDPGDFNTHLARARLAQDLNDLARAEGAIFDGMDAGPTDDERSILSEEAGDIAVALNDLVNAEALFQFALERVRHLPPDEQQHRRAVILVRLGAVSEAQSNLTAALQHYSESLTITETLAAAEPTNPDRLHDLLASLDGVGRVSRARNDLGGALAFRQRGLETARRGAALRPSDTGWRRSVMLSLLSVGDDIRASNDLSGALTHYREALEIARELCAFDPSNREWQRDASLALRRVGDVLLARNNVDGALTHYREGLAMVRPLADADTENAENKRSVASSMVAIGDAIWASGDEHAVWNVYQDARHILASVAAEDATNRLHLRDVMVLHIQIGNLLIEQGAFDDAILYFRDVLEVTRYHMGVDPTNAEHQSNLARALDGMGRALMAKGDRNGALTHHRESLQMGRRLADADARNPEHQRAVSTSLIGIGDVLIAQGDAAAALAHYRESNDIRLALANADPSNARNARDYAVVLDKLAQTTGSGVRWSAVVAVIEDMVRRGQAAPEHRAHLDRVRALAAQQ